MSAVSDSSPLILYAAIGRLDVLRVVFTDVVVPPAVWDEVVTEGAGRPGTTSIPRMSWIHRRELQDDEPARLLRAELGRGEAEAIALADELSQPAPLLLDDRKGRRFALARGLSIIGSAGVLVLAKDRGHLAIIRPLLDELRSAGLYLDEAVVRELLSLAGETPSGSQISR